MKMLSMSAQEILAPITKTIKKQISRVKKHFEEPDLIDVVLEDVPEESQILYRTVLTNTLTYQRQALDQPTCDKCGHVMSDAATKMIVPLVKCILDNLAGIFNIVGVQPMSGPVGLVYTLQYKNLDEAQTEKLTLEILSHAIEASTRKLQCGWTIEAAQDLHTVHGLDIEAEIMIALSSEIAIEVAREILSIIRHLNTSDEIIEINDPTKLVLLINKLSNDIGISTRRGSGNKVIVSPAALSVLQICKTSNFVLSSSDRKIGRNDTLPFVGTLNESIEVYMDMFATDQMTVAYKGGNGETDAGYVYCPYVMVMSSGVVTDPKTFQPVIKLMTRYGQHARHDDKDILSNSENYYRTVKVKFTDDIIQSESDVV